jgi:hypothetical protein
VAALFFERLGENARALCGGDFDARPVGVFPEPFVINFKAKKEFSSGVIEGLNNKAKVTMRRSYGFRTYRILELALYHTLGKLPEPPVTHEFF